MRKWGTIGGNPPYSHRTIRIVFFRSRRSARSSGTLFFALVMFARGLPGSYGKPLAPYTRTSCQSVHLVRFLEARARISAADGNFLVDLRRGGLRTGVPGTSRRCQTISKYISIRAYRYSAFIFPHADGGPYNEIIGDARDAPGRFFAGVSVETGGEAQSGPGAARPWQTPLAAGRAVRRPGSCGYAGGTLSRPPGLSRKTKQRDRRNPDAYAD